MSKIKVLYEEEEQIDDLTYVPDDGKSNESIRARVIDELVKHKSDIESTIWLTASFDYNNEGQTVITNEADISEALATIALDAILTDEDDVSDDRYFEIIKQSIGDVTNVLHDIYDRVIEQYVEDKDEFNERVGKEMTGQY